MAEGGGPYWDPTLSVSEPSKGAIEAILREIKLIKDLKDDGYYTFVEVYYDDDDITKCHVLIAGLPCTPYARGFFYFFVRFPPNYPEQPPKVKLMNTGGGLVRFNPNIYKNGMVCHSLLGTWEGSKWVPGHHNLSDVLEVIIDMLDDKPFKNEPLFNEQFPELRKGDADRYNDVIRHETLRVAVCDMMEGTVDMPEAMREEITRRFLLNYSLYIETCKHHMKKDGKPIKDSDPFFNVDPELIGEALSKRWLEEGVKMALSLFLAYFLQTVQNGIQILAALQIQSQTSDGQEESSDGPEGSSAGQAQSSAAQAESSHFAAAGHSETKPNFSLPEESLRYRTESRPSSNQTGRKADVDQSGIGTGLSTPDTQPAGNDGVPKVVNFNEAREGNFDYKNILQRIKSIKSDLDKAKQQECKEP